MRILIAYHHGLVRAGIRRVLTDDGFTVVGEAHDGSELETLVERTRPDALFLDLELPDMDALGRIQQLRGRFPDLQIVVSSTSDDPAFIQAVFRRGVCGYLLKNIAPRDLGSAIRQAVEGTAYHALGLAVPESDTAVRLAGLTRRETEIVRAVANGKSNKEIAAELWVSVQTVKFHLTNVYRKLHLSNRTEAARWALRHGLT